MWFLPGDEPRLLCDRDAGLQRNGDDPLRVAVGVPHHQPCVLYTVTLRDGLQTCLCCVGGWREASEGGL